MIYFVSVKPTVDKNARFKIERYFRKQQRFVLSREYSRSPFFSFLQKTFVFGRLEQEKKRVHNDMPPFPAKMTNDRFVPVATSTIRTRILYRYTRRVNEYIHYALRT